ncbi:hypothetical protein [Corynebacterium ulceribovis]|uniref:hypothetical protein n=1 Tax=Corynebacterium ulceribovis TaxID=487732 RepID=UPI00036B33D8|nr:hypothetical protein [Corynebacterium ulceribovis]
MRNPGNTTPAANPPAKSALARHATYLATSVISGLYEAVPDYVQNKTAKRLTRVGLLAVFTAAYAATQFSPFEDSDGDGDSDFKEAIDSVLDTSAGTLEADQLSPAATLTILGGSIAAFTTGMMWLEEKAETAIAKKLRRRGVHKPHTLMAFGYAAATYGLLVLEEKLDEYTATTES